jgi:hypothetical protein
MESYDWSSPIRKWRPSDIDERFMNMECREGDFRELLQLMRHRYGMDHIWTQACFQDCSMMPFGYREFGSVRVEVDDAI